MGLKAGNQEPWGQGWRHGESSLPCRGHHLSWELDGRGGPARIPDSKPLTATPRGKRRHYRAGTDHTTAEIRPHDRLPRRWRSRKLPSQGTVDRRLGDQNGLSMQARSSSGTLGEPRGPRACWQAIGRFKGDILLVPSGCRNQAPQTWGLNPQTFTSPRSGGGVETRAPARPVPVTALAPATCSPGLSSVFQSAGDPYLFS